MAQQVRMPLSRASGISPDFAAAEAELDPWDRELISQRGRPAGGPFATRRIGTPATAYLATEAQAVAQLPPMRLRQIKEDVAKMIFTTIDPAKVPAVPLMSDDELDAVLNLLSNNLHQRTRATGHASQQTPAAHVDPTGRATLDVEMHWAETQSVTAGWLASQDAATRRPGAPIDERFFSAAAHFREEAASPAPLRVGRASVAVRPAPNRSIDSASVESVRAAGGAMKSLIRERTKSTKGSRSSAFSHASDTNSYGSFTNTSSHSVKVKGEKPSAP